MFELLNKVIDAQCLFEIIEEETKIYYTSDSDADTKRVEERIKQARAMKVKFLTILN
jgi:hypothetical protein